MTTTGPMHCQPKGKAFSTKQDFISITHFNLKFNFVKCARLWCAHTYYLFIFSWAFIKVNIVKQLFRVCLYIIAQAVQLVTPTCCHSKWLTRYYFKILPWINFIFHVRYEKKFPCKVPPSTSFVKGSLKRMAFIINGPIYC